MQKHTLIFALAKDLHHNWRANLKPNSVEVVCVA